MIETLPVTVTELSSVTSADPMCKNLLNGLRYGRDVDAKDRFNINQTEFTLQQGCILRGIRVYIPKALRARVLDELHTAHFGITRMKSFARSYCWWENIDKDLEELANNCTLCQERKPDPPKVPTHIWETPTEVFQRVHIDFAGPYADRYLMVLVDAYSKWPEVKIMKNITSRATIEHLRDIFAQFGIPSYLVSDRGTQFTSSEFDEFLKINGIKHRMGAPYHPSTNGLAERFVETLKDKLKTIKCDQKSLNAEINNILLNYRKTEHATTKKSPSMMIFNRMIKSRIDLLVPKPSSKPQKQPELACSKRFVLNQRVAVREFLDRNVKWRFGLVIDCIGKLHYKVLLDDNRIWLRHVDQMRAVGENLKPALERTDMIHNDMNSDMNQNPSADMPQIINTQIPDDEFSKLNVPINADRNEKSISKPGLDLQSQNTRENTKLNTPTSLHQTISGDSVTTPALRKSTRSRRPPEKLNL